MSDSVTPLFRPRLVRRDPRLLTRLEVNARFMRKEEYDRQVENVRRDGCLTSTPLTYAGGEYDEGRELVLSGNHRTMASVDADLDEIRSATAVSSTCVLQWTRPERTPAPSTSRSPDTAVDPPSRALPANAGSHSAFGPSIGKITIYRWSTSTPAVVLH
ncbi:hypothetical protein [Streptomyces sp. NPDC048332]|uniref:hypothetical protein n=1 Tax=Streptomyces sp. NPDC048332 TaxID=3154619 RepID=UPI003429D6B1